MSGPRLLVIMGSGETSPTMVKTHREVLARVGGGPAVVLDTPFGFQENADDITARALDYFQRSVGRPVDVARFRRASDLDSVARETALAQIREAQWVFAGPGSPTYTLRQWADTEIPDLLADKLHHGGVVNFASAAALTLGVVTVPVYEIYKVGADPAWMPGLDLFRPLGRPVAVIPHYDNAEGGNHDTRFCYLGERRLRVLEEQLPESAFVLGVDEHTACLLDLDAGAARVVGLGHVTVRRQGRSSVVSPGTTMAIEDLVALADRGAMAGDDGPGRRAPEEASEADPADAAGGADPAVAASGADPAVAASGADPAVAASGAAPAAAAVSPLIATVREQESAFEAAVAGRDVDGAVRAILDLDDALAAWRSDTLQSDEQDRGRAALRRMIVRLGDLARVGARDPRLVIAPYVEQLLALRDSARQHRRFDEADSIRDRLVLSGVQVRDTASGTEWDPPSNTA